MTYLFALYALHVMSKITNTIEPASLSLIFNAAHNRGQLLFRNPIKVRRLFK